MAKLVSSNEVSEVLGVSPTRIHFWQKMGLIAKPTIQIGKRFFYTNQEVAEIKRCDAYRILLDKQARSAAKKGIV